MKNAYRSTLAAIRYDGTDGDDKILGQGGDVLIYGNGGNDLLYVYDPLGSYPSSAGRGLIFGGAGNDTVIGNLNADTLYGDDGHDHVSGGAGNDYLDGGAGNDFINGNAGSDTIFGGLGNDTIYGSASGGSTSGNNLLSGGAGDDLIFGDAGNDYISGGSGADEIWGESGSSGGQDTVTFEDAAEGVTLNLSDLSQNTGDAAGDEYHYIEVFVGSNFNDTMVAGATEGATFAGLDGNDFLNGGAGNDYLDGGAGNDAFLGNGGTDTLVGGSGNDVYGITATSGIDLIVENANQNPATDGQDVLLVNPNVTQLGLLRQGNDLICISNNDPSTFTVLSQWFVNKGVEYVQLAGDGSVFTV